MPHLIDLRKFESITHASKMANLANLAWRKSAWLNAPLTDEWGTEGW